MTLLLSLHAMAQAKGDGGLHPKLRQALEEQGRFPSQSSGPDASLAQGPTPEGVVRLPQPAPKAAKTG